MDYLLNLSLSLSLSLSISFSLSLSFFFFANIFRLCTTCLIGQMKSTVVSLSWLLPTRLICLSGKNLNIPQTRIYLYTHTHTHTIHIYLYTHTHTHVHVHTYTCTRANDAQVFLPPTLTPSSPLFLLLLLLPIPILPLK